MGADDRTGWAYTDNATRVLPGDAIRHPRTGRPVTVIEEVVSRTSGVRLFLVVGPHGGPTALGVQTSDGVVVLNRPPLTR